jgi:hypothetical protein
MGKCLYIPIHIQLRVLSDNRNYIKNRIYTEACLNTCMHRNAAEKVDWKSSEAASMPKSDAAKTNIKCIETCLKRLMHVYMKTKCTIHVG